MTLPITLLPSGALQAMRTTADSFMTTPATLYNITTSYSIYGEPVETSGVLWSGLAYIGNITARDLDLIRRSDFYISRNDGREVRYLATVLVPFSTALETYDVFRINDIDWEIIWHNKSTSDAVQVYTKTIARDKRYE